MMGFTILLAFALPLENSSSQQSADGFTRRTIENPIDLSDHWIATDSKGKDVALHVLSGQPCVIVLFRGHGCYHCLKQLGELKKIESRFRSRGVRLLALSNETPKAVAGAIAARPLPFPVLSDSKSTLATALNPDKARNWHGVLLIDSEGKGRVLVSGSKPLMDFREIILQIDQIGFKAKAIKSHSIE